jgi:hypothetical protein
MKKNNASLTLIILGIAAFWLYFTIQGTYSNYLPVNWLSDTLWKGVFPSISLLLVIVFIFKRKAVFMLFSKRTSDNKLLKFFANIRTWTLFAISPFIITATLCITLQGMACFITDKTATAKYREDVVIKSVECKNAHKRRPAYTELVFIAKDNRQHDIDFSYSLCQENPGIKKLSGNMIVLYGKKGIFGAMIEGFEYPPYIKIES